MERLAARDTRTTRGDSAGRIAAKAGIYIWPVGGYRITVTRTIERVVNIQWQSGTIQENPVDRPSSKNCFRYVPVEALGKRQIVLTVNHQHVPLIGRGTTVIA